MGRPKGERERELAGGVRGLCEPVHRAGAGRRVMSGGEWGPGAPGDWAKPEGVQEFQGWRVGQIFKAGILPKSLFYCQCEVQQSVFRNKRCVSGMDCHAIFETCNVRAC